jgi:hypothetical protein
VSFGDGDDDILNNGENVCGVDAFAFGTDDAVAGDAVSDAVAGDAVSDAVAGDAVSDAVAGDALVNPDAADDAMSAVADAAFGAFAALSAFGAFGAALGAFGALGALVNPDASPFPDTLGVPAVSAPTEDIELAALFSANDFVNLFVTLVGTYVPFS